jgi:hypothetical protein
MMGQRLMPEKKSDEVNSAKRKTPTPSELWVFEQYEKERLRALGTIE